MAIICFIVAGLGVEPSLQDYEPRVHRTLSRDSKKVIIGNQPDKVKKI